MVTYKEYIGGFAMGKACIDEIRSRFSAIGRRIALCSRDRLADALADISLRHETAEIPSAIYERYLQGMVQSLEMPLSGGKSLLLVAAPIGRSTIELSLERGSFIATIPPTYGAEDLIEESEVLLAEMLGPRDSGFSRSWLPLKAIAARAGLARYGRDNVLRFEGAGSYVRLDAWWTELDAESEPWGEPRALDRCATCNACARSCPNGCFTEGRFLVDASKCLTFLNEGSLPFPSWLSPASHNAAVGCLRCQDACPENRGVVGKEVYRRFVLDREETELVLAGRPVAELPSRAAAVVRAAEMVGCEDRLARNLRALIAAQAGSLQPRA
jgi:epoxyqueuosine reductase